MIKNLIKKLFGASADGETSDTASKSPAPKKSPQAGAEGEVDYEGFVSFVVRRLVNNPEAVRLETATRESGTAILIHCDKPDIAKVIGKKGRTISAIRLLVGGAASREGKQVKVDIVD